MTGITVPCCLPASIKTNASPSGAGSFHFTEVLSMEENKENVLYCSHCGAIIGEDEDYETVDGDIVCMDCMRSRTGMICS